jgi:DNA-directed RNA polymerase specialized sigma24 family protein
MGTQPFALMLYRRYLEGETVEQLAAGLGIPEDRIEQRIRVAALYRERQEAGHKAIAVRFEMERTR